MSAMQIERAVVEQALEALELYVPKEDYENKPVGNVMDALRAALAQEQAEPVAWLQPRSVDGHLRPDLGYETCSSADYAAFPVYPAPPQRKPLTEEEIQDCFHAARNAKLGASKDNSKHRLSVVEIARAVERAHGIGGQHD